MNGYRQYNHSDICVVVVTHIICRVLNGLFICSLPGHGMLRRPIVSISFYTERTKYFEIVVNIYLVGINGTFTSI